MDLIDRARKAYGEAMAIYRAGLPKNPNVTQTIPVGGWPDFRNHLWRELPELQADITAWILAEHRRPPEKRTPLPSGDDFRAWLMRDAA